MLKRVGRALLEAEVSVSGLYVHARDIEDYFVELHGRHRRGLCRV